MTDEMMPFGIWLRGERRRLDLSRKALADRAGCAEITLRRIESGTLKPSKELAHILLEQIGIPVSEHDRWIPFARGLSGHPDQPTGPVEARPLSSLPLFLTTFVGRTRELAEIKPLLDKYRLVTMTGLGGVGKTRLAGKIGQQVLGQYPNGVWMVELASQNNPDLVPQTLAAVFGLTTQSRISYQELLGNFLRSRKTLVILDNCEHLSQACAQLAEMLLKNCPDLKILATSREALKVMGEAVYHVPPLGIPEEQETLDDCRNFESIQLFEERAQLAQSDFLLTTENIPFVVQICRRLDGIPLAIELAAARVDVFSIEQIAAKLDESFDLLTGGSRTALPRQQTLRGSIEWSWQLLPEAEQSVLKRLSAFAGGWTLDAAEAVCSGSGIEAAQMDNLMIQLAEKSMLSVIQASGKENRYNLHEMICQFAQEKAETDAADATRTRHLRYFLKFSELAEPALHGPQQLDWLARLNDELDNIRAALSWASSTDIEAGLYIIGRLYDDLDLQEGYHWASEFIGLPESHKFPLARAKALLAQADILWRLEQFDASRLAADESLALFRLCNDREGEFGCLMTIGSIAQLQESMERKVEVHEQALALARSLGDIWMQARALSALGWDQRDKERSRKYRDESITLFRQAGDWRSLAFLLAIFGDTLLADGESLAAQPLLEESLALNRRMNYKPGMEFVLVARSRQALLDGDYGQARLHLQEWITLAQELGNRMGYLYARARLGHVALVEGNLREGFQILAETTLEFQKDKNLAGLAFTLEKMAHFYALSNLPDRYARLIGWVDGIRARIGDIRPTTGQAEVDSDTSTCVSRLGEVDYKKAYDQGRAMALEDVVNLALDETHLWSSPT
jgi:predicted ATPase/DNA-binding XRE family transcriptional regulator